MKKLTLLLTLIALSLFAGNTFTPFKHAADVPRNVVDLWEDYDARKEPLDIKIVKEWKANGVVTRYVTFKVGTFKGTEARIAAYYSYPVVSKNSVRVEWAVYLVILFLPWRVWTRSELRADARFPWVSFFEK